METVVPAPGDEEIVRLPFTNSARSRMAINPRPSFVILLVVDGKTLAKIA